MIKIIADTTCSIPINVIRELNISCLPQIIIFGDTSYRDDCEITTSEFLNKLSTSSDLPKTAAPPPALYEPIFREIYDNGDTAIVITPAAELSGTYRSATIAAQDFPDADIRIIDSKTIGSGLGSIIRKAYEWNHSGFSADDIIVKIEEMKLRERVYFFVDTLEYLYKGGRIGGAQMLVGSLLQVKPILTLKNGRTEPIESQRTRKRALLRIRELVKLEFPDNDSTSITVQQGGAEKGAFELVDELKRDLGIDDIPVFQLPPAVIVHAGPGCLAVSFFVSPSTQI